MSDSKSINCNSCGGSVRMYNEQYGECQYCGNTNKVIENVTIIVKKPQSKPEMVDVGKLTMNKKAIFWLIGGVMFGVLFYLVFCKKKLRTNIQ